MVSRWWHRLWAARHRKCVFLRLCCSLLDGIHLAICSIPCSICYHWCETVDIGPTREGACHGHKSWMIGRGWKQVHPDRHCRAKRAAALAWSPEGSCRRDWMVGDRAFSAAGPRCLNSLPPAIRLADSVDSFKVQLKTYLFAKAYPV